MKNKVLELIKKYGETNPTFVLMMGQFMRELPEGVTYEDINGAFEELYKEEKIDRVSDVNYKAV
mgnify:CR=1 FL=1